jgi:protein-S-isoprenylcysteine O-methyltransferase Ste14
MTIFFTVYAILGVVNTNNPEQWLTYTFQNWWVVFFITMIFTGAIILLRKTFNLTKI